MKTNKFQNLSSADQQLVLRLCDENPYHITLKIIARPRSEGGLDLTTSRSALSRFYTHHHPDPRTIEMLGQYAEAIRIKGQAHSGAAMEALYTLTQNRLLEFIKNGTPLLDLERQFRILERLQRCLVIEEKRRQELGPRLQKDYHHHVQELAVTPEVDFVRNDVKEDPGAEGLTQKDFDDAESDLDLDVAIAAQKQRLSPNKPNALISLLNKFQEQGNSDQASRSPTVIPDHETNTQKSPDFPHFPHLPPNPLPAPNSTKR